MSDRLNKGDEVEWKTSQGMTHGTVEKKLTSPCDIQSHHAAAAKDHPQYLVRSAGSGREAAHQPDALTRRGDS